jgi:hypothetical protein
MNTRKKQTNVNSLLNEQGVDINEYDEVQKYSPLSIFY